MSLCLMLPGLVHTLKTTSAVMLPFLRVHGMWQVPEEGWGPQHVTVRDASTGQLLGAAPMYLKGHSYGEYVFDSSWANYSHMMGNR
jgi:predicted N-acyltransferase